MLCWHGLHINVAVGDKSCEPAWSTLRPGCVQFVRKSVNKDDKKIVQDVSHIGQDGNLPEFHGQPIRDSPLYSK